MATSLLWIAGVVLELVILFRFLKCRLYAHYPFFFAYMAIVCFFSMHSSGPSTTLVRLCIHSFSG